MSKRNPSNTVASTTEAFISASSELEVLEHIHLRERDYPFWRSIVRARPQSMWTDADIENAANLARCKSDIERLQMEIDAEGDTIENQRGTMVVNPKHTLLETLTRRMVALSRMLHVHAEATIGESRDQKKSSTAEGSARKVLQDADDDLIPRASH